MRFGTIIKTGLLFAFLLIGAKVFVNKDELFSNQKDIYLKHQIEKEGEVGLFEEPIKKKTEEKINFFVKLNNQEELLREVNKLSHQLNVDFLEFSIVNVDQFSPKVLAAFIDRIGRYKDKRIDKILLKYSKSDDTELRRRAIRSLGRIQDSDREAILKNLYVNKDQFSTEEQVEIIASYYQALSDVKLIDKLERDLLRTAEFGKEAGAVYLAVMQLNKLDPENKKVIKIAKEFIQERKFQNNSELNNLMIRILARYAPKTLEKEFFNFMEHPSVRLKVELVNVISVICPKDVWKVFEKVLTVFNNPRVHSALMRQLMYFDSLKSEEFLDANKDRFLIDQDRWRKMRMRVLESELTDTCADIKIKK